MKVNRNDIARLNSLFADLDELNSFLSNKIYIDYQDYHDEYSPERTDPCPDYYGYYSLRYEDIPNKIIGDFMTLDELDNTLCLLINFLEINYEVVEHSSKDN